MSKPTSTTSIGQLRNRRRTDLPPSNPPNERRNLEGLVGSIAGRAANQYHRIQNLFRSSDQRLDHRLAQDRAGINPQASSSSSNNPNFSSSSTQSTKRFFRTPLQAAPLQARVGEIEKILGRLELLLQEHSHRLALLEGETEQLASRSGTIRMNAPDTPMSNPPQDPELSPQPFPTNLSHLEPAFVQSLSDRLERMEALIELKEKNKTRAKSRANKLTRFMGLDDQSHPNKRPRI
ncbi:hypothetical protein, variant [Puccinia triticina 1-1 BBBD Race 1]|uniref:Uncharacterized protein n=1 Tax=Puccinia triticina (isolate 1-1 / race 1 (BBBD)) TaxID=630390 RepID=A0A0C4EJN0_PUCT1|nr:hypothetical protein, variant [Puccinia triticina 1-1 BBBD Race 1]